MKRPCVYIMASKPRGTLYIGVTSDLVKRIWQHRDGQLKGFTKKYGIKILVWFEEHSTMPQAIAREKALKKWNRSWKVRLIEETNSQWLDLYSSIIE